MPDYNVVFTNINGCAVGISDIHLTVSVTANSELAAIEAALINAQKVNDSTGLPPHGIRVSERDLRKLVVVMPKASNT